MSLLGRLEDLSLPDIVQIVYLSRRTGMLEIVDQDDRWGIFFVNGLIANAFAPYDGTLLDFLERSKALTEEQIESLRKEVETGEVLGDRVIAQEMMTPHDLAELIRIRITAIVQPLLSRRSGEFNFILSDAIGANEIGYDLDSLFKQGGILPAEILEEGEKAKPLQNLEETMKAGKALLRGDKGGDAAAFGFGEEIEQMTAKAPEELPSTIPSPEESEPAAVSEVDDSPFETSDESGFAELDLPPAAVEDVLGEDLTETDDDEEEDLFGRPEIDETPGDLSELLTASDPEGWDEEEEAVSSEPEPDREVKAPEPELPAASPSPSPEGEEEKIGSLSAPPQARSVNRFRVEGGAAPELEDRNVVLFERNPMLRVAAKRAFEQSSFQIFQFGRIDEVQKAVNDMIDQNRFFVSFLELAQGNEQITTVLLHQIKRTNRHLPVVVIDSEADLARRHELVRLGADMYLTKPSPAHLQPAIADQSLRLFADELVQFADNAVHNWERLTQTFGEGEGAVGATLYEIAEKERLNRTRTLMRSLINELADPDDISQLAQTILRLADEYLDRAALFAASPTRFIGLGGFGPTGTDKEMNELVRRIRIARDADSVLRDVTMSHKTHRGKLRRTQANVKLVSGLGQVKPTEVIAIPIENDGSPVGVLYGDNAGQKVTIGKTSGLEIFLEQAGLALHNAIAMNARRKGLDWETT